jgi:hypothetical protein
MAGIGRRLDRMSGLVKAGRALTPDARGYFNPEQRRLFGRFDVPTPVGKAR